jgi:hypothetical protein
MTAYGSLEPISKKSSSSSYYGWCLVVLVVLVLYNDLVIPVLNGSMAVVVWQDGSSSLISLWIDKSVAVKWRALYGE